jgi:hypothetical protein
MKNGSNEKCTCVGAFLGKAEKGMDDHTTPKRSIQTIFFVPMLKSK